MEDKVEERRRSWKNGGEAERTEAEEKLEGRRRS